MRAWITRAPIEARTLLDAVGAPEDGAILVFLGTVRNQNEGARVRGITYDAYEAMAEQVLCDIAAEAAERLGTNRLVVVHRVGGLEVGDVSVGIAASSAHRADAFDATRYVIEEIKQRLPVWKKEHYVKGGEQWLDGTTPPVPETAGD